MAELSFRHTCRHDTVTIGTMRRAEHDLNWALTVGVGSVMSTMIGDRGEARLHPSPINHHCPNDINRLVVVSQTAALDDATVTVCPSVAVAVGATGRSTYGWMDKMALWDTFDISVH
ncbi:unnamed protein product [Soboliphyme baturini]|uniref:Flavin_Reduct domain-containing protein n=1 Tax=Soboliphyme baturini TaxID=241478 RepID=A0A183IZ34_9BILA|nr:unnamed protein product [Soboliphyme baturini]